ncbi:hypothetical protein QTG54_009685 [Skeletonema marinoi]|uniref:Uncharacterized protein n=1 Tax=Skeletonema marinoi TaxID=267567 RepID=A0AAD8Y563_9STRA|nr:hypothetical protein QTG54_009685 [Skeletonema marinoi]
MTISPTQSNIKPTCIKKSTSVKKARGKDAVPFEEMERLMNLYGSIKALRIRGAAKKKGSAEEGDKKVPLVKKDSIKRKFYRWFPNFEERFTREENGHYQPVNGHEYEMKYRAEMRQKSMTVVVNKRSDSITKKKYGQNGKIAERKKATKSGNVLSRQVSSSDSSSNSNISNSDKNVEGVIGITIPDDIEIDRSNIVMPSPTTTPPEKSNNSASFLDNGYRAPSPLSFQEQFTKKAASEEQDTIFSFVSQDSEEAGASELKGLFDEVDKQYYGEAMPMMQSYDSIPMMHSYGAMPMMNSYGPMSMMNSYAMMNSYDPLPMMNSYDQMQQMSELSALSSMLKSYPAYPMMNSNAHAGMSTMPMNSYDQCFTGRLSDDSLQGSMGNVRNSSSSGNSSINLNEQWGSDSDIEDCLFLGVGNEMVSTRPSFR